MQLTGNQLKKSKRLKSIRTSLGLSQSDFGSNLRLSQGKISKIEKGLEGENILNSIYPSLALNFNVNRDWWETGEGDMFDNNEKKVTLANQTDQIDRNKVIPIYDIEIDAGNVSRLIDDNDDVSVTGHVYLKDSINSSGLIGVRAKGDSMATFIMGGDIMLIRRLESRTFIPPGHAYVIIGKELSVVKYIRNGPDNDTWTLRSHNDYYEDFTVRKDEVVHLFIVVKVLKELTY